MSDFHDRDKWEKYLADFSQRNKSRPARFERFEEGEVAEEEQLTLLESITVQRGGPNAPRVVITRRDQTAADQHTLTDSIANVNAISPQLDQDGSEFGIRFEDDAGVTTILRLQSMLDGDS